MNQIAPGCRRADQKIYLLKKTSCESPVCLKLILRLERGDGILIFRALDDPLYDVVDRIWLLLQYHFQCSIPLGNPGALIEQFRRPQQWLNIHLNKLGAERLPTTDGPVEQLTSRLFSGKLKLIRAGNAYSGFV